MFRKNWGVICCELPNEANLSEEELELQHKKRDWIYLQKSSIEFATMTGLQQGLEQGLEQGEWKEGKDANYRKCRTDRFAHANHYGANRA